MPAHDEGDWQRFFAVTTECFFERGERMLQRHPALYDVLHDYYQQDPARRG